MNWYKIDRLLSKLEIGPGNLTWHRPCRDESNVSANVSSTLFILRSTKMLQ
jgi:hypothetical protein